MRAARHPDVTAGSSRSRNSSSMVIIIIIILITNNTIIITIIIIIITFSSTRYNTSIIITIFITMTPYPPLTQVPPTPQRTREKTQTQKDTPQRPRRIGSDYLSSSLTTRRPSYILLLRSNRVVNAWSRIGGYYHTTLLLSFQQIKKKLVGLLSE